MKFEEIEEEIETLKLHLKQSKQTDSFEDIVLHFRSTIKNIDEFKEILRDKLAKSKQELRDK